MPAKIIILGKPNVGKSSLFNIILKKNIAIVDDSPGLTRDLRRKKINLWEMVCEVVDSPGLISSTNNTEKEIKNNTLEYAKNSNLIILMFDGRSFLSNDDLDIVKIIRKLNKKILLVINKSEGKINDEINLEINKLGLGEPLSVSAAHNLGIDQLKWEIYNIIKDKNGSGLDDNNDNNLSVAIIGKTNTGKSTIFNLLNQRRVSLTGPEPNLTRDSVESNICLENLNFKIFDTAGFSKNSKDKVNKLSMDQTLKKIRLCSFLIIVFDVNDYFERINSKIINLVSSEKRCFIFLVNKIDLKKDISRKLITDHIYSLNPQINGVPVLFVSAKENKGFENLDSVIMKQIEVWSRRIKTNELNNWLIKVMKENPPPLKKGNIVKLKFITQVNTCPPKFNIFSNHPDSLSNPYKRFVSNSLKRSFNLNGLPVKVLYKKTSNPYEKN
ncbi:MAG: ribosome biogenesis GTPase Der [Pseudomonadota bacterium]|nr:ribosome biogenesis GTPase Der [Pseudomonadota bacterium]